MFVNYRKAAIRNLGKHKAYCPTNISGLGLGVSGLKDYEVLGRFQLKDILYETCICLR
jgi:hypothetical protein